MWLCQPSMKVMVGPGALRPGKSREAPVGRFNRIWPRLLNGRSMSPALGGCSAVARQESVRLGLHLGAPHGGGRLLNVGREQPVARGKGHREAQGAVDARETR